MGRRLFSKLQLHHRVVAGRTDGKPADTVIRKGAIKNIVIHAEDRHAGRKFVTKVVNLESYAVDPDELGSVLQRQLNIGASVTKLPGKNETGKELALQGNVLEEIKSYLTDKLGIDANFVDTVSKCK